jgi:hypothetical protein
MTDKESATDIFTSKGNPAVRASGAVFNEAGELYENAGDSFAKGDFLGGIAQGISGTVVGVAGVTTVAVGEAVALPVGVLAATYKGAKIAGTGAVHVAEKTGEVIVDGAKAAGHGIAHGAAAVGDGLAAGARAIGDAGSDLIKEDKKHRTTHHPDQKHHAEVTTPKSTYQESDTAKDTNAKLDRLERSLHPEKFAEVKKISQGLKNQGASHQEHSGDASHGVNANAKPKNNQLSA